MEGGRALLPLLALLGIGSREGLLGVRCLRERPAHDARVETDIGDDGREEHEPRGDEDPILEADRLDGDARESAEDGGTARDDGGEGGRDRLRIALGVKVVRAADAHHELGASDGHGDDAKGGDAEGGDDDGKSLGAAREEHHGGEAEDGDGEEGADLAVHFEDEGRGEGAGEIEDADGEEAIAHSLDREVEGFGGEVGLYRRLVGRDRDHDDDNRDEDGDDGRPREEVRRVGAAVDLVADVRGRVAKQKRVDDTHGARHGADRHKLPLKAD
mmetsp:Transcript_34744/g.95898  ORF Transcript_34744/g.95898 Transcript_34744/m.95898 type:complete len:272 (+) Transcript_34744:207-1022(+)